jgi:hypothetical protein
MTLRLPEPRSEIFARLSDLRIYGSCAPRAEDSVPNPAPSQILGETINTDLRSRFCTLPPTLPVMLNPRFFVAVMSVTSCAIFVGCTNMSSRRHAAAQSGWRPLFDGKTLNGWTQKGGAAKYRTENGELVGTSRPGTPNSFLCTTRDFTNFILELEFKVAPELNSGVQIRSHAYDHATEVEWHGRTYKVPAGRVHGYQLEIDPSPRAWTGGLYEEGRRGWFQSLSNNVPAQKAFKQSQWNNFHIEAVGDSIKSSINGVPAADFHDSMDPSGFIALQVHGVGKRTNDLEVRFRNIRIKELP